MLIQVALNFFIGLLLGVVFEGAYRSWKTKTLIRPKIINIQMYGFVGALLAGLYFFDISQPIKLILIFLFSIMIEFFTGYFYLKVKGIYLWDYSKEPFNFMKIVCLRFSLYWFVLSVVYYYFVLPVVRL